MRAVACALGASMFLGCVTPPFGPLRLADCPGPIRDAADLPGGDFALRERVRVEGDGVELRLELLVERRAERLVLVGVDPFGARVFSAVQTGTTVEVDAPLGRALAVPPGNLLRDLHHGRLARQETPERIEVRRPGCGYTATFVRVERRALR